MAPMQKMIFSAVVAAAGVCAAGWIFLWMARSVAGNGVIRENIIARINDLSQEREYARAASAVTDARAADLSRIREFFVNRKAPVALVEFLEETARSTGNGIALALDESAGDDLVFRAALEGTPETALRTLRAWEAAPYLISVDAFALENASAQQPGAGPAHPTRLIITIRAASAP